MNRKITLILILVLITPVLAIADTDTYRPNDSIGAPENNRDSLYLTETGEIRDFSLSIPLINAEFDVLGAIAFRNVNITGLSTVNEANLSLNFQLDFQSSPLSLDIHIFGYDDDLGNGTFTDSLTSSIPFTDTKAVYDLQNVTSPGFVEFDITSIVQEIINRESWSSGDTLGIILFSDNPRARSRSYQSNYGINRPKLSVRHGEYDYTPEGEEGELIDQYKEYDIWRTSIGHRVMLFEDVSGDGWIINVGNATGTQDVFNYSLPFNIDLIETLQDSIIVIGSELWTLGDAGTNVTLYKSTNGGSSWSNMHSFTVANSLEAWTLSYNKEMAIIHILGLDTTGFRTFYMSYNITSDSTLDSPYLLDARELSLYDIDITTTEDNTLFVGIIGAGPWGSETRLVVYRRAGGSWSSPVIFDKDGAGSGESWTRIDVNYAWDKPNNDRPVYFVASSNTYVYGDRISVTGALGSLEFSVGETPYQLSKSGIEATHMKSILVGFSEEDDPYGAYFDIKLVYGEDRYSRYVPTVSITDFPYPSTTHFDACNYTHNFDQYLIYQDLNESSRVWAQCNNELQNIYEFSSQWIEFSYPTYKFEWDNRKLLTHHEAIDKIVCPSRCFGELYWTIFYPNGTQIIPEEGSCMEICLRDAETIEDVKACIDKCLIPGGGTPDDPSPGDWEDEGPFRRSRMRLYFFIMGWSCFWLPWFYVCYVKGLEKIMSFWVALMISIIGLALLWAIPGI